jgi:hypothetical protein
MGRRETGGAREGRDDPARRTDEDRGLGGLFEDLEQQAAGIHLAERDAELADRARGEYAAVSFASRVHASLGREVALTIGGEVVEGTLMQAGVDWCRLSGAGRTWLVRLAAVATARGMSARALPEAARPAVARLTFGSALHRLAEESAEVLLHVEAVGGLRVRVLRIGADFVEVEPSSAATPAGGGTSTVLVPFAAVLAARPA